VLYINIRIRINFGYCLFFTPLIYYIIKTIQIMKYLYLFLVNIPQQPYRAMVRHELIFHYALYRKPVICVNCSYMCQMQSSSLLRLRHVYVYVRRRLNFTLKSCLCQKKNSLVCCSGIYLF